MGDEYTNNADTHAANKRTWNRLLDKTSSSECLEDARMDLGKEEG